MGRVQEEVIATFTVEDEFNQQKDVFVCQAAISCYTRMKNYYKKFRFGSSKGVEIFQTNDPDVFKLANGTTLRRKKR